MTSDFDIRRSAWVLMKRHGPDAVLQAAMRADELLAKGDVDGCAIWKRIIAEIEHLQAQIAPERRGGTLSARLLEPAPIASGRSGSGAIVASRA